LSLYTSHTPRDAFGADLYLRQGATKQEIKKTKPEKDLSKTLKPKLKRDAKKYNKNPSREVRRQNKIEVKVKARRPGTTSWNPPTGRRF
jgi:hypothetical protein